MLTILEHHLALDGSYGNLPFRLLLMQLARITSTPAHPAKSSVYKDTALAVADSILTQHAVPFH